MSREKNNAQVSVRPVVCAVGEEYRIIVPADREALVRLEVGGQTYFDDDAGVLRTSAPAHTFELPAAVLDAAGEYTVVSEPIEKRLPYCTKRLAEVRKTFRYKPLRKTEGINVYVLSDTHGLHAPAVKAGSFFGDDLDLLILNGDIASDTQTAKAALLPLSIAFDVTHGGVPCVITRGNHDLRGAFAERLSSIYPNDGGRFYYPVSFDGLELIVADCGEDKDDGHVEYGGTVCFSPYRRRQISFLEKEAERLRGCEIPKIVLSHIPFCHTDYDPVRGVHEFDIEQETYGTWVRLINENMRPSFAVFGHIHACKIVEGKEKHNEKGLRCPIVFGGRPDHKNDDVQGTAITLGRKDALIRFTDASKRVLSEKQIEF